MRIALSIIGNLVNTTGGVEKVLCNMANAMAKKGHEVCIICVDKNDGKPFFYLDNKVKFVNLGVNFKFKHFCVNLRNMFDKDPNSREYRRLINDCPQVADKYAKAITDFEPDVFVSFEQRSNVLLKEILKVSQPVVMMFHFNAEEVLRNELLWPIYEKADCLQVLMPSDIAKVRERLCPKKLVHIPNVVPQYEFCSDYTSKIIINVGRIELRQKRQKLLVEAFASIKDKYPDWHVELWGDTNFDEEYCGEIKAYINEYGLQNQVKLCGTTSNVAERLQSSSIFAFPSAYEGFPLALSEAMSMGLPSIGYKDCPAVNELICNNADGILVEAGIEPLANALTRMMDDVELRRSLGMQAKENMRRYAPDIVWNQWEQLLGELAIKQE